MEFCKSRFMSSLEFGAEKLSHLLSSRGNDWTELAGGCPFRTGVVNMLTGGGSPLTLYPNSKPKCYTLCLQPLPSLRVSFVQQLPEHCRHFKFARHIQDSFRVVEGI